jgi:hypothetical protein
MAAGMELARKYRLPAQVRAFISEHHGTRLVTYFYRKASQEKPDVEAVTSGKPERMARRAKNKLLGRALARTVFRWLWR